MVSCDLRLIVFCVMYDPLEVFCVEDASLEEVEAEVGLEAATEVEEVILSPSHSVMYFRKAARARSLTAELATSWCGKNIVIQTSKDREKSCLLSVFFLPIGKLTQVQIFVQLRPCSQPNSQFLTELRPDFALLKFSWP